jgi:hypothetical protein
MKRVIEVQEHRLRVIPDTSEVNIGRMLERILEGRPGREFRLPLPRNAQRKL